MTRAGSVRIVTFPRGKSKEEIRADEVDRAMPGRLKTEREWLLMVVEVGDASPGWPVRQKDVA